MLYTWFHLYVYLNIGTDGTRAFVTGDFTPSGLIDDISDLDDGDYLGVKNWIDFYSKDYSYIGIYKAKEVFRMILTN